MQTEEVRTSSPQTLMQAYRQANREAEKTSDADKKIEAYDKVINFCSNTRSCRFEKSMKRDMLLYWAYNNVARAYCQKKIPSAAMLYWQKALQVAPNDKLRRNILEQMVDTAGEETIPAAQKARNILKIAAQLAEIYKKQKDAENLRRIEKLSEKIKAIL